MKLERYLKRLFPKTTYRIECAERDKMAKDIINPNRVVLYEDDDFTYLFEPTTRPSPSVSGDK